MNVTAFCRCLRDAGCTHVVGLPDTSTGALFGTDTPQVHGLRVITVCREGEAFGIAAGLWAGGMRPVVVIQSTGLFESGDSLRSIALELDIPLDVIIGWRGHSGKINAGYPDTATGLLEPMLRAWQIPFALVAGDDEFQTLHELLIQHRDRPGGVRAYLISQ